MSKTEKVELKRFTTLIQPNLLSQIKLISYFTNKKLNECINESVLNYINDFELKSNTSIKSLISLKSNFNDLDNIDTKEKKQVLFNLLNLIKTLLISVFFLLLFCILNMFKSTTSFNSLYPILKEKSHCKSH